jgi:protein TonB
MELSGKWYDVFPVRDPERLPRSVRALLFMVVILFHIAAVWGVMQITGVRQTVLEVAPIFARWIAPPAPVMSAPEIEVPVALLPKPPPKRIKPRPAVAKLPVIEQVVIEESPPTPDFDTVISVPTQPSEPPAGFHVAVVSSSQSVAPSPRTMPRLIDASAVSYRTKPNPIYPQRSLRAGEEGNVLIRALIDEQGKVIRMVLAQSSGINRLDEAAMDAVQRARFYPYRENDVAITVWAQIPITFTLKR